MLKKRLTLNTTENQENNNVTSRRIFQKLLVINISGKENFQEFQCQMPVTKEAN